MRDVQADAGDPSASAAEPSVQRAPPPLEERPEGVSAPGEPSDTATVDALTDAFVARLTVSRRRDGTPLLTPHCRNGPVDCRARLRAFAELIVEFVGLARSAGATAIDAWVVAAMAIRESGLDPSAIGRRGEAGILQLHPRGAGHDIRYVRDRVYRRRCQARVDACQREVVERAVDTLARGIQRCGGLRGGLGAYASGRCRDDLRYIERVLEERERLRGLSR